MKSRVPPKAMVDPDKELVEGLDSWSIRKGTYINMKPKTNWKTKKDSGEGTFKTQPRPLGFTKRNTISLDALKQITTSKTRPSLLLARSQSRHTVNLPSISSVRLPSVAEITEEMDEQKEQDTGISPVRKQLGYINQVDDNTISPLRTSIGDLMMTGTTSKHVSYESNIYNKYQKFVNDLAKKKKRELQLIVEKGKMLQEFAQLREKIRDFQSMNKRNTGNNQNSGDEARSTASSRFAKAAGAGNKFAEVGSHIMREKRIQVIRTSEDQITKMRKEIEEKSAKIDKKRERIDYLKVMVAQLKQEQCDHYHLLLNSGTDTRQEGLVWIIKAIWGLGCNVNISKLPAYLNDKSVEYLFTVGRKEMELDQLKQELVASIKKGKDSDTSPEYATHREVQFH